MLAEFAEPGVVRGFFGLERVRCRESITSRDGGEVYGAPVQPRKGGCVPLMGRLRGRGQRPPRYRGPVLAEADESGKSGGVFDMVRVHLAAGQNAASGLDADQVVSGQGLQLVESTC